VNESSVSSPSSRAAATQPCGLNLPARGRSGITWNSGANGSSDTPARTASIGVLAGPAWIAGAVSNAVWVAPHDG
jgi:hypothetical protein